jgi:hypothetical protein
MPELMMDSIMYSYVTKTKRIKTRFDATRSVISIELTKYPTYIGPIDPLLVGGFESYGGQN